jgi:WD40 repeat protein
MTSRALVFAAALGASLPALAQTRVVDLKAADAVALTILSPRSDRLAARVGTDRIAVWSLPDGALVKEMKLPQRPIALLFGETDQVVVALADGAVEVRVIATGATLRRMDAGVRQDVLAVSADGRVVATAGTEQIRLWDSSGKLLHTFGHEFGSVASLAFSPDGTLLASAGLDTNVHFWDVATGRQKSSLSNRLLSTFSLTFTPDGKNLVIGGANGTIEIIDRATASIVRRFRTEKHAVGSLCLSQDGRLIGALYFDVNGGALPAPLAVWELGSARAMRRVTPPGPPATAAGFTSDGRLLYTTSKGQELSVWAIPGSSSSASEAATLK